MPPVRTEDARRSARLSSKKTVYRPAGDRTNVRARYNLRHGIRYLRNVSSIHIRHAFEGLKWAREDGGWDVEKNLRKVLADDPDMLEELVAKYNDLMDQLDDLATHPIFCEFDFAALLASTQSISAEIEAAVNRK